MKEWKGNKASTRVLMGINKNHSTNEREQDDFYATDPKAIEALFNAPCYSHLQVTELIKLCKRDLCFWECAAGNGNLSDWLRDNGYNVIASDLKNRGGKGVMSGVDFLKVKKPIFTIHTYIGGKREVVAYVIITNPPFSLATQFVEHAMEILGDGCYYIALMNISYLAGQDRYKKIYSKNWLREVYIFSKRIECWKNNERPKDKCGSMTNYAWYVFQKGYTGQPTLYWL